MQKKLEYKREMGEIGFDDDSDSSVEATYSCCCDKTSAATASVASSSSSRMGPPPPYTPTTQAVDEINAFFTGLPASYHATKADPPPPYSPAAQTPKSSGKSASRKASKDLIGNCKAFRIEHNKSDLRIIGNCNRIRIINNTGNLHIIGNCTRVKIHSNAGHLKYVGNDGRICLGSDSTQQSVDYTGNNGLLKVVNSLELNSEKAETKPKTASSSCTTSTTVPSPHSSAPSAFVKVKSASFGGDSKNAQWQQLNQLLQHKKKWQNLVNLSMPNLKEHFSKSDKSKSKNNKCTCQCKCGQNLQSLNNHKSNSASQKPAGSPTVLINNIGNIIIKNSINVTI